MSARYVLLIALSALAACNKAPAPQAAMQMPPTPASVAKATQEAVPFELRAVGNVEAMSTVQVKPQVEGQLMRAAFSEGQMVRKDQLLFEIDTSRYREALRQAEAAVNQHRADIRQAEASLARDQAQARNADAEAARYAKLVTAGDISASQHDRVKTNAEALRESTRAAQAQIERSKAALEAAQAAVEQAKLQLQWTQIKSPITGRAGSLLAHPGNIVRANETPLVVIHQVAPIYVTFSIPEPHLPAVRRAQGAGRVPVRVSSDGGPAATGVLAVIDNNVDAATGTIKLKGTFDNRDGKLWPGQFVNVVLTLDTSRDAVVVPSEAVQSGQQGTFVYVVKQDATVEMRPVTAGRMHERRTVIEQGVKPGETVVTDGHLMLFPGAKIAPVDQSKVEGSKL
jgi:membrane fusion protein, multidrug efflux system